jgi:hypothetical protein
LAFLTKLFAVTLAATVSASPDPPDTYFIANGQEDGKPLIFRSVTAVPAGVREADFPNLVVIYWRYNPSPNGMPDPVANSGQIDLEDALMPLDTNAIGRQMLVVTGNGRKEWHWYVKNFDTWMKQLNQRLAAMPAFPIEISHDYEPNWSSYKAFIAQVKGL